MYIATVTTPRTYIKDKDSNAIWYSMSSRPTPHSIDADCLG